MKLILNLPRIFIFLILISIFLFFPKIILAKLTFEIDQNSFNPDQEITAHIQLTLQNQANTNYFLEGAFQAEGSSKYFGLTFNDSDWIAYSASNSSNFKKVTTDSSGNWSGDLKIKIDTFSKYFTGHGNYLLIIKRFTENGSSTNSEPKTIFIKPNQTPQPTPTGTLQTNNLQPGISIADAPSQTDSNKSFLIKTGLSNLEPNTQYFLKGAFYKDGSNNYFAKTKVGNDWVKNSQTYLSQYLVKTDSLGNWSDSIEVMPDADDSGFLGSGVYKFKIGKYSPSGGLVWSNSLDITINSISATPTPTATPKPTPTLSIASTPDPTKTDRSIVSSQTVSKLNKNPDLAQLPKLSSNSGVVSGVATNSSSASSLNTKSKPKTVWPFFVGGGVSLLAGIGFLLKVFGIDIIKSRL